MLTLICRAVQRASLLLGFAPILQLCRVSALLLMIRKAARVHLNANHLYPRIPFDQLDAGRPLGVLQHCSARAQILQSCNSMTAIGLNYQSEGKVALLRQNFCTQDRSGFASNACCSGHALQGPTLKALVAQVRELLKDAGQLALIMGSPLTAQCCDVALAILRVHAMRHKRRQSRLLCKLCHPQPFLRRHCLLCTRVQSVCWAVVKQIQRL